MPQGMAVTHADLKPSRGHTDLSSKAGVALVLWTVLCGLCSFILSVIAESTHSQVTWVSVDDVGSGRGKADECVYRGSGKMPLMCATGAFLVLAAAMVVEHSCILIAVSRLSPPATAGSWELETGPTRNLTWQAGFFFVTTWVCFATAEILLLIGLMVEIGHFKNRSRPRPNCLVVREGLFYAAGVFALATVFMATGLYITALRVQRLLQEQEVFQREVMEMSTLYASPPRSPPHQIVAVPRESSVAQDKPVLDPPLVYSSVILSRKLLDIV